MADLLLAGPRSFDIDEIDSSPFDPAALDGLATETLMRYSPDRWDWDEDDADDWDIDKDEDEDEDEDVWSSEDEEEDAEF